MKIEIYPSKALSKIAQEVTIDELPLYKEFIKNMIACMKRHNGLGLAAPQVGVNKRIIVWLDGAKKVEIMINPAIVNSKGKIKTQEGCLSFPNIQKYIKRKRTIEVIALDKNGKEMLWELQNFDAVIVQHEIDHLNGITILSKRKERKKK